MYKNVKRWVRGTVVKIDPIGTLKNHVENLQVKLYKLSRQIGTLQGQKRRLQMLMESNIKEINNNMRLASMAKQKGKTQQMILAARKASRLKDSNDKYGSLHNKIEVMYRILTKMHQNSEILLEDIKDNIILKEQERRAIRTSHSAMKSAMDIISGDPDKQAMFDASMEVINNDVANKVGEMERFMDMSSNLMDKMDMQNGVFEEEGLKMLEKWEKESPLLLMGDNQIVGEAGYLPLDQPISKPAKKLSRGSSNSSYDGLFE